MAATNVQYVLKERPEGDIDPQRTFERLESPIAKISGPNQVLVQVNFISMDPAMRGWMSTAKSYVPPVKIGEVMRAIGVGTVLESTNSKFKKGQLVLGMFGWQKYVLVTNEKDSMLSAIPTLPGIGPESFLGVLGITGLTAYFGLFKIGLPKPGETVLVSGAAGAVGSIVGQLAKLHGCRVVGIAGSDQKVELLTKEFNFDAAVNFKSAKNNSLVSELRKACPKGVDVYFDNVGGPILDDVLRIINRGARVVLCGAISQYNKSSSTGDTSKAYGPKNYMSLLVSRARMEGFVYFDYVKEFPQAIAEIADHIQKGKLKYRNQIVEGLENAPSSLMMLFDGRNDGKLIVRISDIPKKAKM